MARGRLVPDVTPAGFDGWRVGPLDPADRARLAALAAAFPPAAHALPIVGSRPVRIRHPADLVADFWDAIADALVRTAGAAVGVASPAFASLTPTPVAELRDWAATAAGGLDGAARPGLRLELPEGPDGSFRAVLQQSSVDPSLVVDAAEMWDAPDPVLALFGSDADTDLLLALRRGSRAWPPLAPLLEQSRPSALDLDDDAVIDLLGEHSEALATAGFDVLWPTALTVDPPQMRAVLGTPAPAAVVGSGIDLAGLLDFRWEVTVGGDRLSAEEVDALAEAKRPLVRLRGRWVAADPRLTQRVRERRSIRAGEGLAVALAGAMDVDSEAVEVRLEGPLHHLVDRLRARATDEPSEVGHEGWTPPPALVAVLRPYQQVGVAWMAEQCELGLGGCLADDMGLGKTVQVIALHLQLTTGVESAPATLVVCPASLLGNWERELARFAPTVAVRRYHGGDRHFDDLAPGEVVLATYGVVRRDAARLAETAWGLVVADEAQHVKNPLARTARALRTIPAPARFALTGTPVENRLSDLWAILDWTTPGLLGTLESFRHRVAVPVERYQDPEATAALAAPVRPFLLRRRKSDPGIAPELPAKTETDVVVPLTREQTTLYEAVVRETLAEIAEAEGMARRGLVLKLLTALKQVCNHPANYLDQTGPIAGRSGKLAALDELCDTIVAAGDSALVFTQYVAMGRLLESHLQARGVATLFLHGALGVRRRDELVRSFQAGEAPVFLLSLKAGGTGLNLTRATHVVHYDRWWNPAVEDQATDRAYRIGQDRPVQVHRLMAEGTVEDRIAALLVAKRTLADSVISGGEAWVSDLSDDELAQLVALDPPR
ncbi:MAG: DEAD/DEAH box helicase [Acidimicrobiales bacterium]